MNKIAHSNKHFIAKNTKITECLKLGKIVWHFRKRALELTLTFSLVFL